MSTTTSWIKRKSRLHELLKSRDEDEAGVALDRILHGQSVIGKTARTVEIDALRFQDADLQFVGTLERGQFGLVDVVKCNLDGRTYIRKTIEKRFALRARQQCSPQAERDILLRALKSDSVWAPHLLCAFQTTTHLNLVMQYGDGGNLWDVLESSSLSGRVTEDDMAWWAPQIISAVHWCHSQGFAHRDIKPHNFVLTTGAHLLLIDFGSAAPLENGRLAKKHCLVPCGTCDYISPEILEAHEQALVALEMEEDDSQVEEEPFGYGFETDWWSAGAMLYEMLYGVAPFFATDIGKTYLRIIQHEKSLRFDSSIPVSAALQDLIRRFLTDADRRLGRRGVQEIYDHPAFFEINWTAVASQTAPQGLHLPQFTYAAEPSIMMSEHDSSHSQGFAFSALFQSSPMTASGSAVHATPVRGSVSLPQDDAFIGFSWGPAEDAFPADVNSAADLDSTPRPLRVPSTPQPRGQTITPSYYPFLTPIRPGSGTIHQTLPRSTLRRTSGRRSVSDREAMKQLADCIGMSARKKVLESGRKPRVLPSFSSQKALRFLPAVTIQDYASSSQYRARPRVAVSGSGEETTEDESDGPPSPSPTPRPGSAMSMISRRSATPTLTGTISLRSGANATSLSVPRSNRSAAVSQDQSADDADAPSSHAAAIPAFEDMSIDELEARFAVLMQNIMGLEDRLDQVSHQIGR
ncbi:unnamed protein product [Mycena citricolor]|uniref:non-specific serine/threonine protein kinase n=1 Tax=Mycena citricolor TaxID=2018698 RepID=A0AAD2HFV7_9AGAR|nr:unnamed protein product [Mycena citricolor]